MDSNDIIQFVLKDSNYRLNLFSGNEIASLQEKVFVKTVRGKEVPYVKCIIRNKDVQLKPEEVVRQLYAAMLITQYGYAKKRLAFEYQVSFGREKKIADIVVFDKDRNDSAYIIVELKKPKLLDVKGQLRSYCNATGAPIGVWTNGEQISHYYRKDPNYFEDITDIPNATQSLTDILGDHYSLKDRLVSDPEEDTLAFKRRKAWHDILEDNRHRRIYIDPNTDIKRLKEEMYDIDLDGGRR